MYTIVNSSSLNNFNTWSASFHCLFEKEKQKVLSTPREEIVDYINNKTHLLRNTDFVFKNLHMTIKNSFSYSDLNSTIDIISGDKYLNNIICSSDFNRIATFILFIIKDFNIEKKIDEKIKELEEKINFLKSLKE